MRLVVCVLIASTALSLANCVAYLEQVDGKFLPNIHLYEDGVRVKRQSVAPIRIVPFYDSTVTADAPESKRTMIQNQIIPELISFLSQVLRVRRVTTNILINSACTDGRLFVSPSGDEQACQDQCVRPRCGEVTVPDSHISTCRQCNGMRPSSVTDCPIQISSGQGVADADFVLYVSANDTRCPSSIGSAPTTVAFALSCQLEDILERPVAGNVNFCPNSLTGSRLKFISDVTKHEILHALAFSSNLFPKWRDSNGVARGDNAVRQITYQRWMVNERTIPHTVDVLTTPQVVAVAREHFACQSLEGVELENQGESGTAMDHWEKRLLGNEAMTGVFTSNPVFSNFTFAALQDSGWYEVNYSMASDLAWGKNAGCRFVMGSCLEQINSREQNNGATGGNPFCNTVDQLGCTADRTSIAQCNRVSFTSDVDPEYRYFSDPRSGGSLILADFCPYYRAIEFTDRIPICADSANAPSINTFLETYGSSSRCLVHGRPWTVQGRRATNYGGGCYQFSCSNSATGGTGVTVTVNGMSRECACVGEEVIVDVTVDRVSYFGSYICPACQDICFDNIGSCPSETPRTCTGRMVNLTSGEVVDIPAKASHIITNYYIFITISIMIVSLLM